MWPRFPEGRDGLIGTLRRASVDSIDDGGSQQLLKRATGLKGEAFTNIYRAQPHGFTSVPPPGSEGFFLALGGRSDRLVGLGFEHKDYRPTGLPVGASAIYDHTGQIVSIVQAHIRIVGTDTITIQAPHIELDGNVYLGGTQATATRPVSAQGTVTSDLAVDTSNFLTKVQGL